jgi:hypothetical protein
MQPETAAGDVCCERPGRPPVVGVGANRIGMVRTRFGVEKLAEHLE